MKVEIDGIEKIIPERCWTGITLMKRHEIEAEDKLRLTRNERFFLEYYTWLYSMKAKQPYIREFLEGLIPDNVSAQRNKNGDVRYVLYFKETVRGTASAVVNKRVMNACPNAQGTYFDF